MKLKAVLVSFFDSNNIGDLLISDALYKNVGNHFDEVTKIDYLKGTRISNTSELSIDPYHPQTVNKNKSKKTIISEKLAELKLTPLNYFYLSTIRKYPLTVFEEEIKDADALIIGGGNMIFDIFKRTLAAAQFESYVDTAKKHKKKVYAISLGIGPFQTNYQEKKAIKALSKCDYVTFRDEKSYNIYKKNNSQTNAPVHVTVDPVFSMPKRRVLPKDNHTIGINIINNPEYHQDKRIYNKVVDGYVLLIKEFTEVQNKQVKLFSTETRDYEVIQEVYDRIEQKDCVSIVEIHNVSELMNLYSDISILIAARMHAMIIAYTQLLPVVGLSWQPKVEAMFDIIGEPESYFDLTKIQESFDSILTVASDKLTNDHTSEMIQKLEEIRLKEQLNTDILKELSK